ncbi:MAG: ATP synthase subunit I [Saprospiraceae bacterium]
MMNEPLFLILALLAGALLGAFFFGGLWWTVQKGLTAQNPALWFLGSMLVRTGVTLVGFYFVSDGRWERMVACLLGFVVARFAILKLTKKLINVDEGL